MNPEKTEPCFVIFREDEFADGRGGEVAVKVVAWSEEQARAEVERLNKLNGEVARYYWLKSRAFRRD